MEQVLSNRPHIILQAVKMYNLSQKELTIPNNKSDI